MARSAWRTWARSQAWAGSVSLRWCQLTITGTGGTGNGKGRASRPSLVQTGRQTCSATAVTRSLRAARSSAAELLGSDATTRRFRPRSASASSITPCRRPRRDTVTWSAAASRSGVSRPAASGWPARKMAAITSVPMVLDAISGRDGSAAPISRSVRPRARSSTSADGSASSLTWTPGAAAAIAAVSGGASAQASASWPRMVNTRSRASRSSVRGGVSTAAARRTSSRVSSRSSSARGVGVMVRPARTRMSSPVARRIRLSVRLIAGGDRCSRSAAAATLFSSSRASSAISRLRSTCTTVTIHLSIVHWTS
jgi:hypothetical protein